MIRKSEKKKKKLTAKKNLIALGLPETEGHISSF